jgi:uracil-DNA glycosylase family 4
MMDEIKNCMRCDLAKTRTNVVVSRGVENPDILFVGEGPGADEDRLGLPFVGKSGQLLDEAIKVSGIESYAIVNIVKCRPPENRKPSDGEIKACSVWFERQLREMKPTLIVCLGATAYQYFFHGAGITKAVEETSKFAWYKNLENFNVCAIFHPSYILRGNMPNEEYFDLFRNAKIVCEYLKGKPLNS